mgnify:FL=1
MNGNFIEITRDNLSNFLSAPKILVVFGSKGCGGCKRIKPKLKNVRCLSPIHDVAVQSYPRSVLLYPKAIEEVPTIAYFERGYYKAKINVKRIWFDIEKIIKNEYL